MTGIITEVGGFTPLIDVIIQEVGFVQSAVFGVVWRYCQMRDGVCNASIETISEKLGISTRTTLRHIKALCAAGYLEDTTPELRNKPHVYRNTGKVKMKLSVKTGMTESHTDDAAGVTESHSTMTESHSTMTESHSHYDRESHEETKEETIQETIQETKDIVLFNEMLDYWRLKFPNKPQPRKTTKSLKDKLKQRVKSREFLDNWKLVMDRAAQSTFCNNNSWFNFGWLLQNDTNWRKVADGNYDDKGSNSKRIKVRI